MSAENSKLLINEDGKDKPKDRIVSFETEYGFTCETSGNLSSIQAASSVASLVTNGNNTQFQYKPDGDREYTDLNTHPEVALAEEVSFVGAAHRLLHGHVKIARQYQAAAEIIGNELRQELGCDTNPITKVHLIANSTDPSGRTWGNHENLLAPRALEPQDFINPLAIYRLSRIVYTGTGHVVPSGNNGGFRYVLSERAGYIREVASSDTTKDRPLVNLRDEPHADAIRYRRIHDVSGESNPNPHVNAMRLAGGSIILRACELGVQFDDLMPRDPVRAMRHISYDPRLRTTVRLIDGRRFTGIDIQEAAVERALKAALAVGYLTSQEELWGNRILALLDDLRSDPESCASRTSWVVKRKFIDRELTQPRKPNETDYAVAFAKSADFHRLLPDEGAGMKLVRKGFCEESPSQDVLENGLQLPLTRAKLRGEAIEYSKNKGVDLNANWTEIKRPRLTNGVVWLMDPYVTESERLAKLLARKK